MDIPGLPPGKEVGPLAMPVTVMRRSGEDPVPYGIPTPCSFIYVDMAADPSHLIGAAVERSPKAGNGPRSPLPSPAPASPPRLWPGSALLHPIGSSIIQIEVKGGSRVGSVGPAGMFHTARLSACPYR